MPAFDRFDGYSVFEDKGEVKRLVGFLTQQKDPEIVIESLRKMDFCYVITLSKKRREREIELSQTEIDASWDWRNGRIDEFLQKRVEEAIAEL